MIAEETYSEHPCSCDNDMCHGVNKAGKTLSDWREISCNLQCWVLSHRIKIQNKIPKQALKTEMYNILK